MMLGEEVRRLISWESFQQPKYVFQNSNGAISILYSLLWRIVNPFTLPTQLTLSSSYSPGLSVDVEVPCWMAAP